MKVGFIGTGNMGGALAHAAAQSLGSAEAQLLVGADQRGERAGDRLGAVISAVVFFYRFFRSFSHKLLHLLFIKSLFIRVMFFSYCQGCRH